MTAPGYRRGRCSATGKAQYTTRRVAKRVAKSFGDSSRPFRCADCDMYHLGHLKGLTRAEHREYHGWDAAVTPAETIDQQGKDADNATKNPGNTRIFGRMEAAPEVYHHHPEPDPPA